MGVRLKPSLAAGLTNRVNNLSKGDVGELIRIASLDTDSEEFGALIAENPKLALAAKGIEITDIEAAGISDQIASAARGPGDLAASEIGVTVKHKF